MSRLFLLLLLGACAAQAEGVAWRSWDAGLEEARQSGKMVMIDAVRDGCHYCDDMEAAVFRDAEMAADLERCVVPVKVNLTHTQMPLDLSVPMTPSFFFIEGGTRLVKMIPGSWNREDFRSFLDALPGCEPAAKE